MASVCGGRDHDRELYSEEYFASEVSHYIMTVFAFFTYTEYFIAQKCRGRKKWIKKENGIYEKLKNYFQVIRK